MYSWMNLNLMIPKAAKWCWHDVKCSVGFKFCGFKLISTGSDSSLFCGPNPVKPLSSENAASAWRWFAWGAHMAVRACVCGGLTVCTGRVRKNIYHCPKQESSQGVLNGPACLEKPFSKWMPLSIRVSDRNLPRAMPAGNKIASLCAPFLFMRSLFSETKNVKCVQIIFEFVLHGERQGN